MTEKIFLIDQANVLTELPQAPYESEELLQRLLADRPAFLRSASATGARLLFICRELGIPEELAGADRWALDHLFVDREGVPVLVEVKRANDTRSRRLRRYWRSNSTSSRPWAAYAFWYHVWSATRSAHWSASLFRHPLRRPSRRNCWIASVGMRNDRPQTDCWIGCARLTATPVRSIRGIHLSRAEKYPGFPLDDLAQSDTWAGFQDVVSGILERLRAVVT